MSHTERPGPLARTSEPYSRPARALKRRRRIFRRPQLESPSSPSGCPPGPQGGAVSTPPGPQARTSEPRWWPSHWGGCPGLEHGRWLRASIRADLHVCILWAVVVWSFFRTHRDIYNLRLVVGYQLFP